MLKNEDIKFRKNDEITLEDIIGPHIEPPRPHLMFTKKQMKEIQKCLQKDREDFKKFLNGEIDIASLCISKEPKSSFFKEKELK